MILFLSEILAMHSRSLRVVPVLLFTAAALSAAVAFRAPDATTPADPGPLPVTRAPDGPRYWRGNLHTHSLWSDGDDYPEMIADWYKRNGYDFLALTDHNILADGEKWIDSETTPVRKQATEKYAKRFGKSWLEQRTTQGKAQVRLKPLREFRSLLEEPGKFLLVPAEEVTHKYKTRPIHMNAINLRDALKPVDGPTAAETIRVNMGLVAEQRAKAGWPGLTFLNHPNFGWGVTAEDMMAVDELRYFEVFNGHPGVRNYGDATHASTERIWDILNAVRLGKLGLPPILGVATDDAHGYHQFGLGKTNPGRGWVMVKAPYLTAEAVVRSMAAGDFYFTSGVRLTTTEAKEGVFRLSIHAEDGVTYKTEFVATMKGTPLDGEPRTDDQGAALPVTKKYHSDIGKVVATVAGTSPSYTLTGSELYVRAKVTSSKPHPNPYAAGDVEVAWTQPVVP